MPGKHKARKGRRKPRPLQLKVRVVSLPKGTTKEEYLGALAEAVHTHELPEGFDVELSWRNPTTQKGRSKNWQTGEFAEVLSDSAGTRGAGFGTAVMNAIKAQSEFPRQYHAAAKRAHVKAIVAAAPAPAKKAAPKKKAPAKKKAAVKKAPAKKGKAKRK